MSVLALSPYVDRWNKSTDCNTPPLLTLFHWRRYQHNWQHLRDDGITYPSQNGCLLLLAILTKFLHGNMIAVVILVYSYFLLQCNTYRHRPYIYPLRFRKYYLIYPAAAACKGCRHQKKSRSGWDDRQRDEMRSPIGEDAELDKYSFS
jgi:hypothetical protein